MFNLGKDMVKDTCFDFEKKRNEPMIYNRNIYVQTIAAMKRIEEIKIKREKIFWENRYYYLIFINLYLYNWLINSSFY